MGASLTHITLLLTGSLGMAGLAFATQLLLTRVMSMQDYGNLAALLSAVNVLSPLAALGLGWFWLDLFGREGYAALRWLRPALRVAFASTAGCAVLLVAYVMATAQPTNLMPAAWMAALLVPVLVGQCLSDTTSARLQLEERYVALTLWQTLTQFSRACVAVVLVLLGELSLRTVLAGFSAVGLVTATISIVSLFAVLRGRIELAGHARRQPATAAHPSSADVVKAAAPYNLVTFLYLSSTYGLVAIVALLLDAADTAAYNVAFLLIALVYLVPSVVYVKFLSSKLLRWWNHDRVMFASVFHVALLAHAAGGVACAALVLLLGPVLVPWLFGAQYATAIPALTILAMGIPLRFVGHSYGSLLFSKEHIRSKIVYMAIGACAGIAASFVLIPIWGLRGAAAAEVLFELICLLLYIHGARHVEGIDLLASLRVSTIRGSLRYVSQQAGR